MTATVTPEKVAEAVGGKVTQSTPKNGAEPALNLYQKIAAISAAVGQLKNDGHNREQNFDFISWGQITRKLQAEFAAHHLVLIPEILDVEYHPVTARSGSQGNHCRVKMRFTLIDGDDKMFGAGGSAIRADWAGEGTDYGDKAVQKAATSATKYFLMKQFLIAEADDPDAATPGEAATTSPGMHKPAGGSKTAPAGVPDLGVCPVSGHPVKLTSKGDRVMCSDRHKEGDSWVGCNFTAPLEAWQKRQTEQIASVEASASEGFGFD